VLQRQTYTGPCSITRSKPESARYCEAIAITGPVYTAYPVHAAKVGGLPDAIVTLLTSGRELWRSRWGTGRHAVMRIPMDGRGRCPDNIFIERLWRSLKYECVYLHAFETGSELRAGLSKWIGYYNGGRPHSGPGGRTPNEAYGADEMTRLAA